MWYERVSTCRWYEKKLVRKTWLPRKLEDTFGEFPAALCRRSLAFEVTKNTTYHLTEEKKMHQLSHDYFTVVALFGHVSCTVWSIGHLVYPHSKKMFDKFGMWLGINTMQGREAKHIQFASYAWNRAKDEGLMLWRRANARNGGQFTFST